MARTQNQPALLSITMVPRLARPRRAARAEASEMPMSGPGRSRAAGRGVWSPRTTLAYCWRSRMLLGLGAWLAVFSWIFGTTGDRHSTESALLTGVLLMGTGFWALLTRQPIWSTSVTAQGQRPPGTRGILRSEAGRVSCCGQLGARPMWLLHCEDLDVGQPEPAGMLAADDLQTVGGQRCVKLGRHEGVAATTQQVNR